MQRLVNVTFAVLALFAAQASATPNLLISPGAATPGTDATFVIHTPGASWSQAVQVDLGSDIRVSEVRLLSTELLAVSAQIRSGANVGLRTVTLVDGQTTLQVADALRITVPSQVGQPGVPTAANVIVNP
ncbi:MAG TPA: hypothetical protein VNM87_08000, partial [Candidatus Udaeobacter sp.]|nr:hypothetical protein [Candidatus Udaeobacter sp.]